MPSQRFASLSDTLLRLPQELADGPKSFRVPVWTVCYYWFFSAELFLSMILIVLVGPGLISQDLRFNAIPLYLSRPLRRIDYFAGKLGVIGVILAAVVIAPAVFAYVLGLLFSLDFSVLKDTYHLLLGSVAYGLVIVLSAGMLMLALSALSRSSRYVSVFWVGIWLVSNAVAGSLVAFQTMDNAMEMERVRGRVAFPQGKGKGHDFVKMMEYQKEVEAEMDKLMQERLEMMRSNWRPLFSYTANLERMGNHLLNTESAWVRLIELFDPSRLVTGGRPARRAGPSFAEAMAAQHPWQWSAAVLAGLFGVSVWILASRVKSLDRLK